MRLKPARGIQIPGERFKATIEMSIDTAKTDGCFSVVSVCSFQNTPNPVKAKKVWDAFESADRKQLEASKVNDVDSLLAFKKRDFELLDAQKYFDDNSFDFIIESNEIYSNEELLVRACQIMIQRAQSLSQKIQENVIKAAESNTRVQRGGAEYSTMENSLDIILSGEDYTLGYLLDFIIYSMYFEGEKRLSYCGFTKYHPHLTERVLRLAFYNKDDVVMWTSILLKAANKIESLFLKIQEPFEQKSAPPKKVKVAKVAK